MQKKKILFILTLLLLDLAFTQSKLLMVFQVFRHGAREFNPTYSGELTPLGMHQLYLLGTQLRKEYVIKEKFLPEFFDISLFQIRSTGMSRTIQSASSFYQGFYPPGTGPITFELPYNTPVIPYVTEDGTYIQTQKGAPFPDYYQPMPIHSAPFTEDKLLNPFNKYVCPPFEDWQWQHRNANVELEDQIRQELMPTFQKLQPLLGKPAAQVELDDMWLLYDELICKKYMGVPLPKEITPQVWKTILFWRDFMWMLDYGSDQMKRTMNQPMFSTIIQNFDAKIQDPEGYQFKWITWSGHDMNIVQAFVGLEFMTLDCVVREFLSGVNDPNCESAPQFGGNLIFELHEINNEYFVKIKYNGQVKYFCENNTPDGLCRYEEFTDKLLPILTTNFDRECGIQG